MSALIEKPIIEETSTSRSDNRAEILSIIDVSGLPDRVIRDIRQLVESLRSIHAQKPSGQTSSLIGRFAHLGLSFSEEEIKAARRELWSISESDPIASDTK